jgi:S1-C subfamily serine protease
MVTSATIQFDGIAPDGASGSPIFNAAGEAVGVHYAAVPGSTGAGFAVPISRAIDLLPTEARAELGLR